MEINEFNQEKLRLLDTEQLLAFYGIFGRVSSPKAEAMVKGITRELKRRNYTLGEENLNEVDVKSLMKGLVKGTTVAGKGLAKAIKVGYPIAKDMVKATWMTSKKIGGAIGDLMDDPEFRKLFTKYVDNPNDKNRTKKIQAYADGMLSDAPISGFESVTVKEERLKKVCSLVLGEDFDQDFIYENVDFTKPSAIKDGYKSFALKEKVNENRAIVHNPKGIKRFIKQVEEKFPQYKGEIEQLEDDEIVFPDDEKLKNFFKGAKEVKFVLKDSVDLEEVSAKDLDVENLKQMIKNPDPKMVKSYGGSKYVQMLKKKLAKLESTDLEEAVKFWTVTITKKAGKLFKGQTVDVKASNSAEAIKKGLKQMKANPNTVPSGSVDAVLGESIEESNKDKYMWGDINKALSSAGLNPRAIMNVLSKLKGKALKESRTVDLDEADAADGAMKGIKAKERLNFIDNIMSTYEGKSLAFYKKMLKKSSKFKDGKLTPYELSIIKREMKRQKQKSESTDFEKTNVLTYDEYDEVQNFQNFNKKDWKRNAIQKKYVRKNKV